MSAVHIAKVLVVDDEVAQMRALCRTLEPEGYSATGCSSAAEALQLLCDDAFDLILTDLMMPELDGIGLLRAAFAIDPNLVGIVMTGQGTVGTAVEALKAGALDYVLKPFRLSVILPVLSRALDVRRLRMENIQLREAVGIYELSMANTSALDFDTVLEKVADAAFLQSRGGDVSILLPSADGKELHVATSRGVNAGRLQGQRVPLTDDLNEWIGRCRSQLARPDEPIQVQSACASPLREITAGVSIPMISGGRLVGLLNFASAQPQRPVSPGQLKALNFMASAAASSLEAASLLEQLRAAEQRYRRLAENAPDIVFRYELHPKRSFAYVSPVITEVTGYSPEEFYADPDLVLKIAHPEDRQLLEKVLAGEQPGGSSVTMRWTHKNGSVIWIEQRNVLVQDRDGLCVAVEGIGRDVTERKQLEDQLRHSQKMEAVGRLTGGVAHDFNNLLTVINGYSDLMLSETELPAMNRQQILEIKRAGEQAAVLTRQLLAFSRRQLSQPATLNVNKVVESNAKILRRVIGEDLQLITSLDRELGTIKADPGQIEQVLMNLVVNARDAMARGGKLTIETRNVTLDESYALRHASVTAGPYVVLAVSDTGSGMDEATQSRIFEPFFTTKELGRGTGLGLSIVYGIVQQNGGHITVRSELGKGTTFTIHLPRIEEKQEAPEAQRGPGETAAGSETILVVEDDSGVRQLICAILQQAGYKVLPARQGADALQICRKNDRGIGLVLTDLVMPHMSGPELVEQLMNLNHSLRVLYTSGYADDATVNRGRLDPRVPFVQKPFTAGSLLKKVREVLDGTINDHAATSEQR